MFYCICCSLVLLCHVSGMPGKAFPKRGVFRFEKSFLTCAEPSRSIPETSKADKVELGIVHSIGIAT